MLFDPVTAQFQLVFDVNTDIDQPTIVFINEDLNYPHGKNIKVSPDSSLTWTSTSRNYYEFKPASSTKNGTRITISIAPKTLNWFQRFWNWLKMKMVFWRK